ncbi:histidinol-phosphate phosphatase family protein [Gracilibacillus halotolerans]|uniref:D,D-heptose 1,7-bisphosphate phosphatase n=1 Tax=Gracilibacillus halotolerans TaxID=74386 RepID=A0A841RFA7_9BACI|nr:HAD-IIIA family hydrolase [Gracilibacillus halotolerans]MBB6511251.1 histidinol-phosphate phosphatase family protein [Gracilibacillus halotolerans]
MSKAIFIDRDGTIGGSNKVLYPNEFVPYPYMHDAIRKLKEAGYAIYAFSNQPGISKGEVTIEDFEKELKGYGFDNAYICPHTHQDKCSCRKPSPYMLQKAANDNALELEKCIVIGDRWTDMLAAHEAGCKKVLVKTGAGQETYELYNQKVYFGKYAEVTPEYVADDLLKAAGWIVMNP